MESVEGIEVGGRAEDVESRYVEPLESGRDGSGAGRGNLVEDGEVEGVIVCLVGVQLFQEFVGGEDGDVDAIVGFECAPQSGHIGVRGSGDESDVLTLVEDADMEREGVVGDGVFAVGS